MAIVTMCHTADSASLPGSGIGSAWGITSSLRSWILVRNYGWPDANPKIYIRQSNI